MTKQIKAFPCVNETTHLQEGMDLRDYIATAALQGILSCGGQTDLRDTEINCRKAYRYADQMLKARERDNDK